MVACRLSIRCRPQDNGYGLKIVTAHRTCLMFGGGKSSSESIPFSQRLPGGAVASPGWISVAWVMEVVVRSELGEIRTGEPVSLSITRPLIGLVDR